jgi:hypothetical protein
MVETPNCACCGVVETPWHVVGECGHAKSVEIRVDWAKRMWELVQRGELPTDEPAGCGRSECTAANVEGGGRRSPPNMATWSEKHHTRY